MNKGVIGFVTTSVIGVGIMTVVMWNIHTQFSDAPDTAWKFREVAVETQELSEPRFFGGSLISSGVCAADRWPPRLCEDSGGQKRPRPKYGGASFIIWNRWQGSDLNLGPAG
ncbi:MAG: hypothetical protein ACE5Q6_04530 [Dehalococcoidia bacterium]